MLKRPTKSATRTFFSSTQSNNKEIAGLIIGPTDLCDR
jgi:hypothetical protein